VPIQGWGLMACDHCGSRMLAKAPRSSDDRSHPRAGLVCADCGRSIDPQRQGEGLRRSWRAATGLALLLLIGCLAVAVSLLQEAHQTTLQEEPAATERSE